VGDTDLQIFTYTAQDYDPETGLLHFYARYYDPATGAWLTQDSYRGQLLDPVSLHRYGYVGGNPVSYWDLLGWKTYYLHGTHADAPQKDSDDYKFAEDFASRVWNDEDVEYLEWNSWYAPEYNGRPGELNNDRISRGMAAINLAYAIRSYLAMHPEECDNINLMGHSHGGNVIIEALGILQAWGIHINGVALFGTPVRSDYTIPSNSVSKVYNVYGEQRISVRPPSISSRVDLSAKANLDIDVNLDTGGIGFRLPTYGNLNPIQVRPPRLSVDMEAHLEVNIDASVDIDAGRIDVEGDYVPLAACTDYGPQHAHGFENICGIAGQRRSDPEVDIVNANVPGLNPTSAHSDVKNPDYLRNSSEVCQNIPGYCD
jgi:RHS repeat-associated protein